MGHQLFDVLLIPPDVARWALAAAERWVGLRSRRPVVQSTKKPLKPGNAKKTMQNPPHTPGWAPRTPTEYLQQWPENDHTVFWWCLYFRDPSQGVGFGISFVFPALELIPVSKSRVAGSQE